MRFTKKNLLATLALAAVTMTSAGLALQTNGASAQGGVTDPTMRLINGTPGVKDTAVFNENGETVLGVKASPGYGTRSNMSNLDGYGLVDVREFTTTIRFDDVVRNISTLFSLQTIPTGTIGEGNGNGINILMRMDADGALTIAFYNQTGAVGYGVAEYGILLDDTKEVHISYSYDNGSITLATDETTYSTETNIASAFDSHYEESDYLAYWSLSSYYMGSVPSKADCVYTLTEINGQTPLAYHTANVENAVEALEAGYNTLTAESTADEINAVTALNVFGNGSTYAQLLAIADNAQALQARVDKVIDDLSVYEQRVEFDEIDAQFDAFIAELTNYNTDSAVSKRNTREAYEAIDFAKMDTLPSVYKSQLEATFDQVKAMPNFATFIVTEVDDFFAGYEDLLVDGDVTSLTDYKAIKSVPATWEAFKAQNGLDTLLEDNVLKTMEARASELSGVVQNSFYTRFWTEGNSWEVELSDMGLYATGAGTYGETLGLNKKLTVGQNASITFNIIYALKTLGANHLHIGFYPVANTGTFGVADGVRVDFWFAGNTIEIKPVNGATETEIFTGAYLAVEDTGYFDMDEADYDQGKYTVELVKNGNVLAVRVNGWEMELDGLTADLFANGCYMTISAMSVQGADQNELLITEIGGVSYINYDPSTDVETPPTNSSSDTNPDPAPSKKGCGSVVDLASVVAGMTVLGATMFVTKNKKENE